MANWAGQINEMIERKRPESLNLEYKKELPGRSDDDKKEFSNDVAAFMNAMGGEIIFGVGENEGIPSSISPIECADRDEEERRLSQILRDTIEPRGEFKFDWIELEPGKFVLSLTIPPSANLPHRVLYKGRTHFFVRNDAGKHSMSMDELRNKFQGFNIAKREFKEEVIQLAGTFAGGAVFLKDKIFTNCILNGPANVMFSGGVNFGSMSGVEIVVIQPKAEIRNAVLFDKCKFDGCSINNSTLYLTPEQYAILPDGLKNGLPLLTKL